MTVGNMDRVQLFDAGKKGRGLRATKELNAGEVVFAEPSFSAVVFDSLATQVCHSCFRRQDNLHRCAQCKFAHYCDRTCQTACWDEHKQECGAIKMMGKVPGDKVRLATQVCHSCFRRQDNLHRCAQCKFAHYCDRTCQTACWDEHKQECGAIKMMGKVPGDKVRLAARVLWRIHKDTGVVSDSQLISVDQLEDHVTDLPEEDLKQLKTDVHTFLEYWTYGRKQHSVDDIAHIFGIIKCNGFPLSDQRGLQAVGLGLFPNLSLLNHDCRPNCVAILNHGNQSAVSSALHSQRRVELRAVGPVSEGEELTVSYVDLLNLSADRQKKLKEQFHFQCSCQQCSQRVKDDLMMAAAESQGNKPSADQLKEGTAFSKEYLEKIERSRLEKDHCQVVRLCRECLEKQDTILADTHLLKLRVLSVASEVLSYLQSFSEAADYARRMVEGYIKLYHPHSAQLGMATMRAGVTLWHAGRTQAAHGLICKAYGILMVTHGPNHHITRDLESMRMQTEMELKMFKQKED